MGQDPQAAVERIAPQVDGNIELQLMGDAGDVEGDFGVGEEAVEDLRTAREPALVRRQAPPGPEDVELGAGGDGFLEVPGEVVELGQQVSQRFRRDAADGFKPTAL